MHSELGNFFSFSMKKTQTNPVIKNDKYHGVWFWFVQVQVTAPLNCVEVTRLLFLSSQLPMPEWKKNLRTA